MKLREYRQAPVQPLLTRTLSKAQAFEMQSTSLCSNINHQPQKKTGTSGSFGYCLMRCMLWRLALKSALVRSLLWHHVDGLVQDCSISSALAMEIPGSVVWFTIYWFTLVASLMSLMATLVTTSRMQQCFNVRIDICHEFLLLFYCSVPLEIKLTTTTVKSLI